MCDNNIYFTLFKSQLKNVANQYNTNRFTLWSRDELLCDSSLSEIQKYQLNKQTKKNYLFENKSTHKLTKKQQYARLSNGHTLNGYPRKSYASQTENTTNLNTFNLIESGLTSYSVCKNK